MMPVRKPKLFKLVSARAQRFLRKFLEPRADKRTQRLTDLPRYLEDRWLAKSSLDRQSEMGYEDDGLCPSMYSFHSSIEEKNKLLSTLVEYGIETTVDRKAKKDRIRNWIQSSVIEEDEEEDEGVTPTTSSRTKDFSKEAGSSTGTVGTDSMSASA